MGRAHRTHGVAQRACQPALRVRGSPGVGGLQPEMQELAAAAEKACAQQVWGCAARFAERREHRARRAAHRRVLQHLSTSGRARGAHAAAAAARAVADARQVAA